jgi:hypothetical protein
MPIQRWLFYSGVNRNTTEGDSVDSFGVCDDSSHLDNGGATQTLFGNGHQN